MPKSVQRSLNRAIDTQEATNIDAALRDVSKQWEHKRRDGEDLRALREANRAKRVKSRI